MTQRFHSRDTSLNQVPATFKRGVFAPGSTNLDLGGGRFDTATEFLREQGVKNLVLDPFNRSEVHNLLVRHAVAKSGGVNSVSVNNVLNVIFEGDVMDKVVAQAAEALTPDGTAYFLVYEGDRTGVGKETTKGWQRNSKAADYLPLIAKHFRSVARSGNLITARDPVCCSNGDSFFSTKAILMDALVLAKRMGVPLPSSRHGCGKLIGGCLYVHKSAVDVLPVEAMGLSVRLDKSFVFDVVKWNPKEECTTFIHSPDWDIAHEPEVWDAFKVSANGTVSVTKKKADPQIYHHKWNFVRPEYTGFDYTESVLRSLQWAQVECDRSRIGTKSYWEGVVLPLL